MAARLKVAHWYDDLYGMPYTLLKGDREAARRWIAKRARYAEDSAAEGFEYAQAITWLLEHKNNTKTMVLWFPKFDKQQPEDLSTLAHEAFHAVTLTMTAVGLPLDEPHDEAYAYYLAWVFRECYRRLV